MEFEYRAAAAITPHDTNAQGLDNGCSALIIGTAGNLAVKMANGAAVTIPIPTGVFRLNVLRVLATGTTAAGITALWH